MNRVRYGEERVLCTGLCMEKNVCCSIGLGMEKNVYCVLGCVWRGTLTLYFIRYGEERVLCTGLGMEKIVYCVLD